MKNILSKWGSLTMAIIASFSIIATSCSNDEPEQPQSDKTDRRIVINADGSNSEGANFVRSGDDTFWINSIQYHIQNYDLIISGYNPEKMSSHPVIYSEVTLDGMTYKTRSIKSSAFYKAECIRIDIPSTVNHLGAECFRESKLETIYLPKTLTSIESS